MNKLGVTIGVGLFGDRKGTYAQDLPLDAHIPKDLCDNQDLPLQSILPVSTPLL